MAFKLDGEVSISQSDMLTWMEATSEPPLPEHLAATDVTYVISQNADVLVAVPHPGAQVETSGLTATARAVPMDAFRQFVMTHIPAPEAEVVEIGVPRLIGQTIKVSVTLSSKGQASLNAPSNAAREWRIEALSNVPRQLGRPLQPEALQDVTHLLAGHPTSAGSHAPPG